MPNFSARLKKSFDALPDSERVKSRLAAHCKVSKASVSDWFSKETKAPSADALLRACEYLKVSPYWLMFGKGEMKDKSIIIQPWPFEEVDQEAFARLSERQKGLIEERINSALAEIESKSDKAKTA
jgi:transcriptional regulator with XRE-family HTH domain